MCEVRRVRDNVITSGAGEFHYFLNLCTFIFSIAMNRTFGTNGFFISKFAATKPLHGIIAQVTAIGTKVLFVIVSAIHADHTGNRVLFFLNAVFEEFHCCFHTASSGEALTLLLSIFLYHNQHHLKSF